MSLWQYFYVNMFAVLAEPNRRLLLDNLRPEPQTVTDLVEVLGLSQPAVSKHLRVLREAGLVTIRPEGQRRWYEINPEPLTEVDEWLDPYRRLWADRLGQLEHHLDNGNAQ